MTHCQRSTGSAVLTFLKMFNIKLYTLKSVWGRGWCSGGGGVMNSTQ